MGKKANQSAAEIKKRESAMRGQKLLELIEFNFGTGRDARTKFAKEFDRKPATVWPWCHQVGREGIPHRLRKRFEDLVRTEQLVMPSDGSVEDYMRPAPMSRQDKNDRSRIKNEDLLALFYAAVRHPELGRPAVEICMSDPSFVVRVLNPSYWLRWAYHYGGVPFSYQNSFTTALIKSKIAEKLMGYEDAGKNEGFFLKVNSLFAEDFDGDGA